MKRPPYRPKAKQKAPTSAAEAAPHVRKFVIRLFDRDDGEAAPWAMIAETLFQAAFDVLDRLPGDDATAAKLLRRVHAGAYNRMVKSEAWPFYAAGKAEPTARPLADRSPQGPSG